MLGKLRSQWRSGANFHYRPTRRVVTMDHLLSIFQDVWEQPVDAKSGQPFDRAFPLRDRPEACR